MLLAAGSHDRTVDPGNTRRLAERLRQAGAAVEEHVYYPGFGHRLLIGAFAPVLSFLSPVRRDTVRFIAAHTGAACLTEVE